VLPVRLGKYLAICGVASRRRAEELIREGRVTLGAELVTDPAREVVEGDAVALDGTLLQGPQAPVVYALHKPLGVLSTARDTHGRRTVTQLVPDAGVRLYPVGRLDRDTSGLILLTNDGALAHRLTHPSFGVERVYLARVQHAPVRVEALRALRRGVELDDGPTAPADVRLRASDTLELTLHEGRKRQVRRMCEAVGHPVLSLCRVRFGPLQLGALKPGEPRRLTAQEVEQLRSAGTGRRPRAASFRAEPGRAPRRSPARPAAPPSAGS
jgi:23S rRNA pseudouridine2605 synthase